MSIGSETGIEENTCVDLDDTDYAFIGKVIFGLAFGLVGLLALFYFLVWGDVDETLKQIAPVAQSASKK